MTQLTSTCLTWSWKVNRSPNGPSIRCPTPTTNPTSTLWGLAPKPTSSAPRPSTNVASTATHIMIFAATDRTVSTTGPTTGVRGEPAQLVRTLGHDAGRVALVSHAAMPLDVTEVYRIA